MTQGSSDLELPAKCKHMMASKLTSEENTYMDLVKKRKLPKVLANPPRKIMDNADDIQMGQPKNPAAIIKAADRSGDNLPKMPGQSTKTIRSGEDHRALVEIIDDYRQQYPFGQPKNTTATIEAADGNDDDLPKMPNQSKNMAKC
jgi:hypothetical protein